MKFTNIIHKFVLGIMLLVLIGFSSCKDFLEQPSDAITTIDSVFANPDNAMLAMFNAYDASLSWNRGLRTLYNATGNSTPGYPTTNPNFGNGGNVQLFCMSDEATQELGPPDNPGPLMLFGNWGPTGQHQKEFPSIGVSNAIRTCNIFIENAPRVPLMTTPKWVWNEAFRDQVIAEVRVLRAFLHFETFRRYGGIPILDRVSTFEQQPGQLVVTPSGKRQSLKSVINFIVSECDACLPKLKQPEDFSNAETGRIHYGFALALKAKALLYAASPLYNEAGSDLPLSYGDDRDSLLCYGNYDPNRWKLAADAYQTAIDWAEGHGKVLLDDPTLGKTDSYAIGTESPRSTSPKNDEWIYYISTYVDRMESRYYRAGAPTTIWAASYGTIAGAGYKFIKNNYRDVNGNLLSIPDSGTLIDLKKSFRKAEPRFNGSIWVPGTKYSTIDQTTPNFINYGTTDSALFKYRDFSSALVNATSSSFIIPLTTDCPGLFYPKKWRQIGTSSPYYITWTEFRLSEFYLSFAEALNEVNPSDPNILIYLNKIRVRGGIPEILTSDPRFGNKTAMREEIRRERAVELYGDEHRYFDVRRWKIADQTLGGDWIQVILYQKTATPYVTPTSSMTTAQRIANDATISFKFQKLSTHVWAPKMYFYPYYQTEVDKKILVQNPGW